MKDIQKLVEQYTTTSDEGTVVEWSAVEKAINDDINAIVAKQTDKVADKAKAEVFSELGLEGVSDKSSLLKHIESLSKTDEALKTELSEKEKALEELNQKYSEVNAKTTEFEREKSLLELGITDADNREFLLFNVGKRVTEEVDWNTALEQYREEKPHFFATEPTVKTTGAKVTSTPKSEPFGFEKILAEKHPDVFKKEN